ncbi:KilA, N-terminal/APSES-type HTH, DNA-binding family [Trichomonas vaginalis G3]|uniref:KilA, N-terminal/APSES-type HTH, DNA-binding family n=1 Tax=Trichomonas vaginalis (strain ATCC PRA-98 / G3) TaxID=412133 RepID=UPI0021E627AB|nr:KilA, N-terminal/APSES-type HTH, DNA-binding family [Trichomonas vaginalis G3]KAI5541580.1 KilA, N-terminal/APSES-type HTH, DNA-binding family [Trichomonas vaginalis G3]
MSTTENTTTAIVHEAINEEYEYIQYNKQLRLIRSVKDDMYQMQSIMNALSSTKQAYHWFENQQAKELLEEFPHMIASLGKPREEIPFENREKLPNGLRGYYVHRLLVNAVAMWASPRYAWNIYKLLDELHRQERGELEKKLQAKDEVIESKDKSIQKRIPRSVPKGKEKSYKYMIYTEELEKEEDRDMVMLHLVRRNNKSFYDLAKIYKSDRNWFYRENLPISMTPNEQIKEIVKSTLPQTHYDIKGCTILTFKEDLPLLKEKITEYFDNFKEEE